MTDNNHPITPPPELIQVWLGNYFGCIVNGELSPSENFLATQAARWGADQELEACCEWLQDPDLNVDTYKLRAARRPKPPSLKEQALQELDLLKADATTHGLGFNATAIRHALESLPD